MLIKRKKWLHRKLISHKLKVVYLRIPKCASGSVIEYIKSFDQNAIYKSTRKYYKGYFNFTVIRDDDERLYSAFREKIWRNNFNEAMVFIKNHPGLYWKMPWDEFKEYAAKHDDPHWIPCQVFIDNNKLDRIFNYKDVIQWKNFPKKNQSKDKSIIKEEL